MSKNQPIADTTRAEAVRQIKSAWNASVKNLLEAGKRLVEAKANLQHGEFQEMIELDLPFGPRHAQRLMAIARDERLSKTTQVSHFVEQFPTDVGTLYELTRLNDEDFETGVKEGWICPETDRQEITLRLKAKRRDEREVEMAERTHKAATEALTKKYGVIYMDPAWDHETYGEVMGKGHAAANHYQTMTDEELRAIPVADWAAPDCACFMWTTGPHLAQAMALLEYYGFDYKTHAIWVKRKVITGYWFRFKHELVLLGVKGDVPAPALGTQMHSVFEAPNDEHSVKPDDILDYIDRIFPNVPKLEMNARRARDGWDAWGNEAPQEEQGAQ